MAGNAEELGAGVARVAADAGEPRRSPAQDGRRDGDGFDIVDGGRAAVEAGIGRERRLEARLPLLAFQAFQQGGFLAADIGAGAAVDVDIEVPARAAGVAADQPGGIGLLDRGLQALGLAVEFAADIDIRRVGAHCETGDQAAFDQLVRIVAHDVPVLAGAGLGFVGIDDQIVRAAVALVVRRHEGPFEAGREAGAAPAAQAGILDLLADPGPALLEEPGRLVPVAPAARALQAPVVEAVEVGEDAVAVVEHQAPPSPASALASTAACATQSSRSARPPSFSAPFTQSASSGVQAAIWSKG